MRRADGTTSERRRMSISALRSLGLNGRTPVAHRAGQASRFRSPTYETAQVEHGEVEFGIGALAARETIEVQPQLPPPLRSVVARGATSDSFGVCIHQNRSASKSEAQDRTSDVVTDPRQPQQALSGVRHDFVVQFHEYRRHLE